ncbi:MAG: lysine transporter LysE [Dehalococcoidia bacterium]|nr:MAG: lysine transporter LysE [Dehalococcoidia bacterium]
MWPIIASVVVISLSGVMMPGPMFAVTLAKSYKSPWAGAQMALGHAVVEVPLILLIYFGFSRFFQDTAVQIVLSLAGGAMIVWLGVSMFRDRAKVVREGKDLPYPAFVAGIVMSALNPLFLLWWATIGSLLVMQFLDYGVRGLFILVIIHWLCDLVWLTFVSVFINKTHHFLDKRFQEWLFIATSLFLVFFGFRFIISGIQTIIK